MEQVSEVAETEPKTVYVAAPKVPMRSSVIIRDPEAVHAALCKGLGLPVEKRQYFKDVMGVWKLVFPEIPLAYVSEYILPSGGEKTTLIALFPNEEEMTLFKLTYL